MPTSTRMRTRLRKSIEEGVQQDGKKVDGSSPSKKGEKSTRKNNSNSNSSAGNKTTGKRKGPPKNNAGSSKKVQGGDDNPLAETKNEEKSGAGSESFKSPPVENKDKSPSKEPMTYGHIVGLEKVGPVKKNGKVGPVRKNKKSIEDGQEEMTLQQQKKARQERASPSRHKAAHKMFEARLEELKHFKDEHGHTNVPKNNEYKKLGRWVNAQRQYYKKREQGELTSLTEHRIKLLEDLGFSWSMNKPVSEKRARQLKEQWEQKMQELRDYKSIHGDVNIPVNGTNSNKELGKWVMNQRYYFKEHFQGRKNSLTPERIQDLENLGFVWSIKGRREGTKFLSNEEKWERNIEELIKFKEKFGHTVVIKSGEYKELGQFVANVRYNYRRRLKGERTSLLDERIETLDDLGFDWKVECKGDASKVDISVKTEDGTQVVELDKEIILPDGSTHFYSTKETSQKRYVLLDDGSQALEISTKTYTTKIRKSVLPPEDDADAEEDPADTSDADSSALTGVKNVSKSENQVVYPDGSTLSRATEESMEKRIIVLDDDTELLETTTNTRITKIERIRLPKECEESDSELPTPV